MNETTKLNITQWAEEDRPREKMMMKGIASLSDAELLAILIGSGNRNETAVELMRRMLITCENNLNELARWNINNYSEFKGMGPAKSITIMAALEIGRRRNMQATKDRTQITCSKDIFRIFHPLLCDIALEEFWILLINQSGKVIDKVRLSTGGIAGTFVDIRLIFREALLKHATQLAVVHNHPSGNRNPSQEDKNLTLRIAKASETMNIRLIDHVIICEDSYYSFADEGVL